jgi:YVTN family beta-propeller protein
MASFARRVCLLITSLAMCGCAQEAGKSNGEELSAPLPAPLVTGRSIEPKSITSQNVGNIAINMIASPDGKFVVTTDQGFHEQLWATRISDGVGVSKLEFPRQVPDAPGNGLYYGLAFGPGRALYAAQGANDTVAVLHLDEDGKLSRQSVIKARRGDFPSGLAVDSHGRLYVANNDTRAAKGQPYKLPGSMAIYDTADGKEIGRFEFSESFGGTPNFPMAIAVLSDGSKVYVASQRDAAVYVLKTVESIKPRLSATLPTGAHPVALLFDKSQSRLFVANAQSDTVSVVDTRSDQIISTILLRPEIAKDVTGRRPTAWPSRPIRRRYT